ncbi:MAG: hypothetical protein ACQESN_00105 [Thermotogota bacterium]
MGNIINDLNELIDIKHIIDAYESFKETKYKIPYSEIFLNSAIENSVKDIIEKEEGFFIKNSDINEETEKNNCEPIDVGDLFILMETFEKLGIKIDYLFSRDNKELFLKAIKTDDIEKYKNDSLE